MTSPTSPSARIGNPCLVHCEKMRFTVRKFENTPLLPLDPLDQFTESWSDWEFLGPISWDPWKLDMFFSATISQEPRFDELGSQQHPQLFFFATDGFQIPFFWGSRLVTLWEPGKGESASPVGDQIYVYQLPCDLGLGNPLFLFVFWWNNGSACGIADRYKSHFDIASLAWSQSRSLGSGMSPEAWMISMPRFKGFSWKASLSRVADMPSI